jgi:sensor domain CHASE-containing protein
MINKPFKNRPRARSLLYAMILLAVLLPVWWLVGLRYQDRLLNEKRSQISGIITISSQSLSAAINRRVSLLKGLKAFVDARLDAAQGISPAEFATFAGGLHAGSSGIRNFTVAPDGAEPLIYTETDKARTFASDPARDRPPNLRADLQRAVRSRRPVLSGPYPLRQKGLGLQAAQAVYRGDASWGVVSMTLDLTPLLAEAGLEPPPPGLAMVLQDRSGRPFYGGKIVPEDHQAAGKVELPDGFWKLAAAPEGGWSAAVAEPLLQFRAITLTVVLLLTVLFYLLASYRMRLKLAVRLRTGDLQRSLTDRREEEVQLNRTLSNVRQAMGATLDALALAVETKDPYTSGHQRRTADLVRAIATEMGLAEDEIDGLRMAVVVHDIGKIGLPAEILSKPAKLSELEFNLVKMHSQSGYDILKEIEFPWPIARAVWQHHERLDGSGYPLGLSGEEILPAARILAVADVVEAMMSPRSYRPIHGMEKALEEIEAQRGVLYDPAVVDACLRIFREKDFRLS